MSGYHSVSSQSGEIVTGVETDSDAVFVDKKTKAYLLQPPGENNGNMLPGAVILEDRKFEGSLEKVVSGRRDANVLPGAIGLDGKFDETTESLVDLLRVSSSKPKDESGSTDGSDKNKGEKGKKSRNLNKSQHQVSQTPKKGLTKGKGKKGSPNGGESEKAAKSKLSNQTSAMSAGKSSAGSDKDSLKGEGFKQVKGTMDKAVSKNASKSSGKSKKAPEPTSSGPLYTGPHPMNRNMSELQVPGDVTLDDAAVQEHYRKLVKAYLAPFADGITRKSFFEILRRRTYSLAPPGSNKGIQTLLFQLMDKSKLWCLEVYTICLKERDMTNSSCHDTNLFDLTAFFVILNYLRF